MTKPPWIRRHLDDDGRYQARDEVGPFRPVVWLTLLYIGCFVLGWRLFQWWTG